MYLLHSTDETESDHEGDRLTPTPPPAKRFAYDDSPTKPIEQTDFDYVLYSATGAPAFVISSPPQPEPVPDGSGTIVAVLDSGINSAHMALVGKVLPQSRSFVSQDPSDISDVLGHGTQCAGIACGTRTLVDVNGQRIEIRGIATGAKVLVCKVVPDGSNEANIDSVCNALDYVAELVPNLGINVVSLSFGTPYYHEGIARRILSLLHSNVVVVCAASNDGRSRSQPISYPARMGDVLCIGACSADSGEATKFSPVGREIDFLAPGKNVWAPSYEGDSKFLSITGTSFAAPAVAGLVCQIVEDLKNLAARANSPNAINKLHNVWVVREILKSISTVQGHHDEKRGYGVLEPMKYFGKSYEEKTHLLKNILGIGL